MQNGKRRIGVRISSNLSNHSGTNLSTSAQSDSSNIVKATECPICGLELPNLSALNDHLDVTHFNDNEKIHKRQDSINSWLTRTLNGASALQMKAAQRLWRMEPYEQNGDSSGAVGLEATKLTDSLVVKNHWQPEVPDMVCHDPMCDKLLNFINGHIHCRKCGYIFCNFHSMYQIKLSIHATYDSENGFWCRVCRECYEGRPGYNDSNGLIRSRFQTFETFRKPLADKRRIEFLRLSKRMKKLEELWTSENVSMLDALLLNKAKRLEQSIVHWQDDSVVQICPECNNSFTLTRRRRHCRLCGRVICRFCVLEISLPQHPQPLLICMSCNQNYFRNVLYQTERSKSLGYIRHIEHLQVFRQAMVNYYRLYEDSLSELLSGEIITEATLKIVKDRRKKFLELCVKYDGTMKKIANHPSSNDAEEQFKQNVVNEAKRYLQETILRLQAIPYHLQVGQAWTSESERELEKKKEQVEKKQEELMQTRIVLEEQVFLVENMIEDAKAKRKFSEVETLLSSLAPLHEEIHSITEKIHDLDLFDI
ncbi:prevacuole/endosomal FYVE tethering component Pep7 [Schizosaccharomyces pombe]|uniref:Vacuolar segregation protein pep7 n=1 Tax=Schizosaccharomyces pombe (strain 972 / ATCC 24843) TaxID=284812 RepID=PEP7_SCHPO|nr:putative FYVE tethering component Pep7 [Schizosaccharomyces pombe]O13786.1 RecName: Full=Vacuolar segregation protein pep7 [Schizosaccharomyces pombe 972h-]CAB16219.1 prevacuole/endosomal FYVE tethering component Pep7 (predicted) [Schizosaccharomyces pombe]|eukprot:NP_594255.1 putative FYVE tethering component Pep7 [Schizosaccharomyces pombe]